MHEWIRQDRRIHGIGLPGGGEIKTSGFADDSALYVGDPDSLASIRTALDMYCRASAASLNHDKTVGVMLGGHAQWVQPHMRVDTWVTDRDCERYLGAYFGEPDQVREQWDKAINKMKSREAKWALRELSLYGRCLVHKASIASCLWFMCTVMDTPEHARVEMKGLMDKMIWRGGVHLIKHEVCCMPQAYGGFKKMDTDAQLLARQASWGKRYLDPECPGRWVNIVREWLREGGMGPEMWVAGRGRRALRSVDSSNLPRFWKECIKAMWKVRPRRIAGADPNHCSIHTHQFQTVTIVDYCTVQYNNVKWEPLSAMTVKLAYWSIIRYRWGVPIPVGRTRWEQRGAVADWPFAWSNVRCDSVTKKQAGRSLKLMHCVGQASSRLCAVADCHCGVGGRVSMWHGVFECEVARRAWRRVEEWWHRLGGRSDVSDPIHKLTVVDRGRGGEVEAEVWRLLCACMLDILWVGWTRWVHEGAVMVIDSILRGWEALVLERVEILWTRAVRLSSEYDRHIDYVPGCIWSKPKVDHMGNFSRSWEGPLGRIVQGRWVPTRLV